jgi:GWxTD domain-containing protein
MRALVLLLAIACSTFVNAQLDAYLDGKYFMTPEGPIYETYLEVYASTVKYQKNDQNEAACAVEVIQILKKGDSIVQFYKEVLTNAEAGADSVIENLMQVKRFQVENGAIYSMEVSIKDVIANTEAQTVEREVIPHFSELNCDVSDIVLLSSFTETTEPNVLSKSGYDLLPLLTDFYTPEYEKIAYYFEYYNTDKHFGEGKFLAKHYIRNKKSGQIAGNFLKQKIYHGDQIIPVLHYFDISSLPSGDYELVAEVRDKENQLIVEKTLSFSRLNLSVDISEKHLKDVSYAGTFVEDLPADSLDEFIYCLYPIVSGQEDMIMDNQMKHYDDTMKRRFIYSFWYNFSPSLPEKAWLDYKEQVILADKMFGTSVKEGYETDRGRVFLKYGAPNTVTDRPNEPSSYPYQIWHYYKVGKFNNKRFVFYQPDLVTNDYELLHSDLQGEVNNANWQVMLNKRNSPNGSVDDVNNSNYDHWGSNTNVLFNNP